MARDDSNGRARFGDLRRRDFLHAGAVAGAGLSFGGACLGSVAAGPNGRNCILLLLVGGPSHIDTWDMKPDAPSGIRSPFRPIRTNVPGIEISEIFPRLARHADKFAIVRGLHHEAVPVHDAGFQLLQTGRVSTDAFEYPHVGSVLSDFGKNNSGVPAHVLLGGPLGNTGGNMRNGQSAAFARSGGTAARYAAVRHARELTSESDATRRRYGLNSFGRNCLTARRLVESGVRFVTVNMFDTVFDTATWDMHGFSPFSSVRAYRDTVGPMFDLAFSTLVSDLHERGMLSSTMVIAAGEFGRTPRLNPAGGRDHWPQCSSMLIGGGPVRGGQIVGSSDADGAYPKERPSAYAEVVATMYHSLGLPLDLHVTGPNGLHTRLLEPGVQPISELFV